KSMKDMRPFAIDLALPTGYANYLPSGTALVIQMHYVNTGKEDILVRDMIRLKKVAESTVTHWAAPFAANSDEFSLPPHSTDITKTFDCAMTQDADLLLLGGHMHENGATFKIEIGPDADHLITRYNVTAWKPDFRDAAPVELFTQNPLHLTNGSMV